MTTISDQRSPWISRVTAPFRNWSTSKTAYPLGYSPGLDGVRGLMTLAVLGAHTRGLLFPGAIVFMDSFFAMSGYLITSILLNDTTNRAASTSRNSTSGDSCGCFPRWR